MRPAWAETSVTSLLGARADEPDGAQTRGWESVPYALLDPERCPAGSRPARDRRAG
jgi:hypothetical protein